MGTKVQCKSYLPGYNSMRDINEDSNSSNWPHFYGDKPLTNGQYYNNFTPRTVTDSYPTYDKDVLKQKMLEHEAIFKNQVYELHRLYRIQRDMMEEVKRKERYKHQISIEASSSSSRLPSQIPSEDSRKWHIPSFPLSNPSSSRPSILGADVINSPLSCTNGTSPLQNGSVSKGLESSRPSKVRKKLFDLQLPADEYIDTEEGEQVQENNDNNSTKLFLGGKIECRVDTLKPDSRLRGSVKLADLNEPIRIEPASAAPSVDFLGRSASRGGQDLVAKQKSPFLGLPQEFVIGSKSGTLNNLSTENKGNGREWLSYMHEAGSNKSNPNPFPQCLQPEKQPINSHPMRITPNKGHHHHHQPLGIFSNDNSRGDLWGEKKGRVLEISDRIQERCNYNNNLESVLGSRISGSYPFVNSSDLANYWSHSVSPWANPNSSLTQKLTSVQRHLSFNSSLSKNSQPSDQTHEILGDNWHVSGGCRSNPGLANELPIRNGFYQGSSSGSKELSAGFPSVGGFDYMNRNKGSNFMDLKSTKDMNLNVFPLDSSNEAVSKEDTRIIGEKGDSQDQLAMLPWLRAKPAHKNEPVSTNFVDLNSSNHVFTCDVALGTSVYDIGAKNEINDGLGKKKFGFPIFGNPRTSGNDSSFLVPTSASLHCSSELEETKIEVKRTLIDINVACDAMVTDSDRQISAEPLFVDKGKDSKPTSYRQIIDLNLCMSEDEDQSPLSHTIAGALVKIAVEIDLEADPVDVDSEEQQKQQEVPFEEAEQQQEDEFVKTAAEAILAISAAEHSKEADTILDPYEASMADSLLLLFKAVSLGPDDLGKESISTVEIDYFEAMTLQLPETKEEDYLPEYTLPEIQETEETGPSSLPTRPRRGQARRGRQRRDFQRDILPGLTTLSRHEITEDLQTFGGLMRATGHNWPSGSSRRSGGRSGAGRGRRRAAVDPAPAPPVPVAVADPAPAAPLVHSIEVGLKDTNLTGWGKTTRRPRRQRCPAGNPIAVALT